jgi:hypothetical protein
MAINCNGHDTVTGSAANRFKFGLLKVHFLRQVENEELRFS